jgi:hypothetical protein
MYDLAWFLLVDVFHCLDEDEGVVDAEANEKAGNERMHRAVRKADQRTKAERRYHTEANAQ